MTTPTVTPGNSKNALSQRNSYLLLTWLSQADLLPFANNAAVAEAAAQALGFRVTDNNIQGGLDALQMELPAKSKTLPVPDGRSMQMLARCQVAIFERLQMPVPADLRAMAGQPLAPALNVGNGQAGSVSFPQDSATAQKPLVDAGPGAALQ